jgi:hypothetical protein
MYPRLDCERHGVGSKHRAEHRTFGPWPGLILAVAAVLASAGLHPAHADDPMNEPYGSRYQNYTANALWTNHYGVYSDGGWPTSLYPKFIEDVNGDGMADAVAFGKPGTFVSLSNGQSFVGITEAIDNFGTDDAWQVSQDPRFVVDINGDGKKDLAGFGLQGVWAAVYTGTATTPAFGSFQLWSSQFGSQANNGFYLNAAFIRTMRDMNKDGKTDLVVFSDTGVQVALSNGNGFNASTQWINNLGTNDSWNNTDFVREIADVNGDGFLDILGYGMYGVYVAVNNGGSGFNPLTTWTSQFSTTAQNGFYKNPNFIRTSGDINGDGKTDLIVFADDGVYTALSTGSAFAASVKWTGEYGSSSASGGWNNTDFVRQIADVNGDSMADIVGFAAAGTNFSMSTGQSFGPAQQWVNDFGYNQNWRVGTHPRFMRDVNGDGVLDITGYGDAGVLVSPSSPLYCCDATFFPDPVSSQNVVNGAMARVFVPAAFSSIVMPGLDPNTCPTAPYIDEYHAVGPNSGQSQPWLNVSWRTELGARFAVNANFFDIGHGPQSYPCSVALGLTISNGVLISPYSTFNGNPTSTLVIYNLATAASKNLNAEILPGTTVSSNWQGQVQFAFSGMSLIQNGVAVPSQPVPTEGRARAAVGITRDGKTLLFVIQNNGHDDVGPANERASLPAMANALLRMGAYNALNLDGSGSSQYWFKNNVSEFKSMPSDFSGAYRGIPVAFGIK